MKEQTEGSPVSVGLRTWKNGLMETYKVLGEEATDWEVFGDEKTG